RRALADAPAARAAWEATTTLARVDWIHWITSAKQPATRTKRVTDACQMLASGKRRVCCFDPSGYYSKAFAAPKAATLP
ncbi:MAG TPA: YdeI/OmpD-associated family protein, partial [Rhodopila sp.]|nr:YdeI/OmpD-associated family protein [Rhodopila sp.]